MTTPDPVFTRLAGLPAMAPAAEMSARLRAAAHARLRPRRVSPTWTLLVAITVVGYLGLAVRFSSSLYGTGGPTAAGPNVFAQHD